ncbi:MAG: NUDIX hydrolase [Balneolaceae bacterium]|nr:NUDIX hydrolase [Balneolaceae bacterium]
MSSQFLEFTIEPWITTTEQVEYTTNIFKLLSREMKIESENHQATFSVIKAPDWVNVIPVTAEGEIVLVEQYRYGIEQTTLELPGGVVDPGETPEETSKRELVEETGFAGTTIEYLGKVSSNPAIFTNYTHTYLIENCTKVKEQQLDGNERINVHIVSMEEFLEYVDKGWVHHSLVVAAVARYLLKKKKLRL